MLAPFWATIEKVKAARLSSLCSRTSTTPSIFDCVSCSLVATWRRPLMFGEAKKEITAKRGYRTIKIDLPKSELKLYGSKKLMDAVKTMTTDVTLYEGVRSAQILEAVYRQGKNDGARDAFKEVNKSVGLAQKAVPHKRPGRPKKKYIAKQISQGDEE